MAGNVKSRHGLMRWRFSAWLWLLFAALSWAQPAGHEWQEKSPESQGLDIKRLVTLSAHLRNEQKRIRSIVIVRNEALVYEYYRDGVSRIDLHDVASVTKSVVGALMGIALHEGRVRSVDQPISDFFPEALAPTVDPRMKEITLKHLLTLTSGLETEPSESRDYSVFYRQFLNRDWMSFAMNRPVRHDPGSTWYYSNVDVHLVSVAIARQHQMPIDEYAKSALFRPLGITQFSWAGNQAGEPDGAAGLKLTPRDMAKLGQLYLQAGEWRGKRLLSAAYVADSTRQQAALPSPNQGYGYLWRTAPTPGHDAPAYFAVGYGGQYVYVVPKLRLVVVAASERFDADSERGAALTGAVIRNFVLPAIAK